MFRGQWIWDSHVPWLLDTNVVSEPMRPAPSAAVRRWMTTHRSSDCFISVMTIGELEAGLALLPSGRRRAMLNTWIRESLAPSVATQLLPVTADIAAAWGQLNARARKAGRALGTVDGLLLATAQVHELAVVTRNIGDFAGWGVEVVNPWDMAGEKKL